MPSQIAGVEGLPGQEGRGRVAAKATTVAFQLLFFRIEIEVDDEGLAPALRYLATGARQPITPRATIHYIVRGRGPYELLEDGEHLQTVRRPGDVLFVLYRRCHARLLDHLHLGSWAAVHGGMVAVDGRRALVVGDKGVGKTTLCLRLLHDLHRVEGDELVFFRRGAAVCLPRNFHVKPGTPAIVPELIERWADLPATSTSDGTVITSFDPSAAGFDWRLDLGPIDVVFVLKPNHGRAPDCRPLAGAELMQAVLARTFPSTMPRSDLLRSWLALVGAADAYELTVGHLGPTAELLVSVARA